MDFIRPKCKLISRNFLELISFGLKTFQNYLIIGIWNNYMFHKFFWITFLKRNLENTKKTFKQFGFKTIMKSNIIIAFFLLLIIFHFNRYYEKQQYLSLINGETDSLKFLKNSPIWPLMWLNDAINTWC